MRMVAKMNGKSKVKRRNAQAKAVTMARKVVKQPIVV